MRGYQEHVLLAYQVSFDLCENDNQKFLGRLTSLLPVNPASASAVPSGGWPAPCLVQQRSQSSLVMARVSIVTERDVAGSVVYGVAESVPVPADASESLWSALDTVRSILDGTKSLTCWLK